MPLKSPQSPRPLWNLWTLLKFTAPARSASSVAPCTAEQVYTLTVRLLPKLEAVVY